MESDKPKILVIVGPTTTGKSDLAVKLARKFHGEIISADSRQVYKGMNLGTGKITKKEMRSVPHHLLDVVSPKKVFTVVRYQKLGKAAIKKIIKTGKIPIIVGGTGFYIDALINDVTLPEVKADSKLRKRLDKLTIEDLFKTLRKLDPQRAKKIDSHNKRRLIRALEIIDLIGKVPYLNTKYEIPNAKYNVLWLGLNPKNLEKRIKLRLEKRLKQGMLKEVKNLLKNGVSNKRLYDFGLEYRWVGNYLSKKITRQEMGVELLRDIVKYSKRQMTWFKRNKEIHWVKNQRKAEKITKKFISHLP